VGALSAATACWFYRSRQSQPKWEWLDIGVVLDSETLLELHPDDLLQHLQILHQKGVGVQRKAEAGNTTPAAQTVILR